MADQSQFDSDRVYDLLQALGKVNGAHLIYKLAKGEEVAIQAEKISQLKLKDIKRIVLEIENELEDNSLCYKTTISSLRKIRKSLDQLNTPPRETITNLINSKVNVESVCVLLEADSAGEHVSVDLEGALDEILDCMAFMCAAARDINISQLRTVKSIPKKIGGILVTLREMDIDMLNYMLGAVKGTCRDNWKSWVRAQFDEIIALTQRHDVDILRDVREWFQATFDECKPLDQRTEGARDTAPSETLIRRSLIRLLNPERMPLFPSTLEFEVESLVEHRSAIYRALIMKCVNLARSKVQAGLERHRGDDSAWNTQLEGEVHVLLSDYPKRALHDVLDDVSMHIGRRLNCEGRVCCDVDTLSGELKALTSPENNSVLSIMVNRIEQTLDRMLRQKSTADAEIVLRESNHSDDVKTALYGFYVGCSVNRYVFSDMYDNIALKLCNTAPVN